ncbi:HNH endonuclease [Azospirillum sp.]|uniref:HNH endonuclease n=1 Tax=Azospirillum sp. TaxID=34012 RepID=UPI003D718668
MCTEAGRITAASIADHVEPHRGDEAKFFDPQNTQSLCKSCHDSDKQRAERAQ